MRLPIPRIVKTRKHMKHRIPGLLLAGLMMCSMINAVTAAAAEMPATESSASVSTAYAINIQYPSEEGGIIAKVYEVKTEGEIGLLPREDMTYQGRVYQYQDISVEGIPFYDEKPCTEVVTGTSSTKDADTILATLEPQREVTTEDGYTGMLTPDKDSLKTEANGYGSSTKTKSVTRTYTGLADQDLIYIPKSVTEDGAVYTLINGGVTWSTSSNSNPYDPDLAPRYNATAVYSRNYTTSYATGYDYEIQYTGTLVKDGIQGYRCTVIFAPAAEEDHWYDVFVGEEASPIAIVLAIILGLLLIAGIVLAIYYLVKRNKDDEQVETTEEYYPDDSV